MAFPTNTRATVRNPLETDLDHVLSRTAGLWEELRGQRIFVTGGTGFFGCWLLETFVHANERLNLGATGLVLTRDVEAFRRKAPVLTANPALEFHCGDVRSFSFPDGRFSHILHAATASSISETPRVLFDTVVHGTQRVLDFASSCRATKFLLCSSGAVYGRQPADMTHVPETFPGSPDCFDSRSVYGEGKRAAELLCSVYAGDRGFEPKIARCFAFVGPYQPLDAHFAIANFIRDGLAGGPIRVGGDGTPYRSYLYAADLMVWLWTILFRGVSCRPYNVGSDAETSIADLATTVACVIRPDMQVSIARQADPTTAKERYVPCIRRAREELGLQPTTGLEESIRRTIAWHREAAASEHAVAGASAS